MRVLVVVVQDEPYPAAAVRDGLFLTAIAADLAVLDRDLSGDEAAERTVASGSGTRSSRSPPPIPGGCRRGPPGTC